MIHFQRKNFVLGVAIGIAGYVFITVGFHLSPFFATTHVVTDTTISSDMHELTVGSVLVAVRPYVASLYQSYLAKVGTYDIFSDDSLQKFVNKAIGFQYSGYVSADLVSLHSAFVAMAPHGYKLRAEAADQLYAMAEAFYGIFKKPITILSSYRSYEYQKGLYGRGGSFAENFIAPPGHSEHQAGLAVDIFLVDTKSAFFANKEFTSYYQRLFENAHLYGFHNSYQKGVAVDTYNEEPWHWRYLGTGLATELHERNMTFGEYYTWRMGENLQEKK